MWTFDESIITKLLFGIAKIWTDSGLCVSFRGFFVHFRNLVFRLFTDLTGGLKKWYFQRQLDFIGSATPSNTLWDPVHTTGKESLWKFVWILDAEKLFGNLFEVNSLPFPTHRTTFFSEEDSAKTEIGFLNVLNHLFILSCIQI